ncbi:hypothetical protein EDF39_2483 [Frondihabitans sp. PhB161]|nr:hypothetical protein EDF37_3358 [Frondihabitans sp. PhB153]RPF04064.1 hypothetical protein EDF39_2483 [Frondihabitans sp. PhB161]
MKRSIRACLGEALGNGIVFNDFYDDNLSQRIDYSPRWASYADDYVTMCLRQVRAWEHEWSGRRARRTRIPAFDDWLHLTGNA